jgi:hypothetical protein
MTADGHTCCARLYKCACRDSGFDAGLNGLWLHIGKQIDHHLAAALPHPKDGRSCLLHRASTSFAFRAGHGRASETTSSNSTTLESNKSAYPLKPRLLRDRKRSDAPHLALRFLLPPQLLKKSVFDGTIFPFLSYNGDALLDVLRARDTYARDGGGGGMRA